MNNGQKKGGNHRDIDARSRKLQYLLIKQLLDKGTVELLLPDGITLEIGITQDEGGGKQSKSEEYCYVVASREGRSAMLDAHNVGLQYEQEEHTIVCEDEVTDDCGRLVKTLDVL